MESITKSEESQITERPLRLEGLAVQEIYFSLGLLAAKKISTDFGVAEPLVNHMIDQEVVKSNLRFQSFENQSKYDHVSEKYYNLSLENERLVEVSNKDSLTGLFNRRGAEIAYSRLVDHTKNESNRRQKNVYDKHDSQILIIDVDNFKLTNDTYGHGVGDNLLSKIAKIMTSNTRQKHVVPDVISRIGGDEFLILMYGAPRNVAEHTANAIRNEVKDLALYDPALKSSVSIGIGAVNVDLSLKDTVDLADRALLQAKKFGKDIVVHFDDLTVTS